MTVAATFDGRVFVPAEPVSLPVNTPARVTVADPSPAPELPPGPTLLDLLAAFEALPDNPDAPIDGSINYKHYLYGLPKRS